MGGAAQRRDIAELTQIDRGGMCVDTAIPKTGALPMTRLRLYVSSLLLASSLSTAVAAKTAPTQIVATDARMIVQLDRAQVRAKLAQRRAVMIERFLAYREARVYPWIRSGSMVFSHMWFDDMGNLCAAATLISKDWGRDSTLKFGETNRVIALADVKSGEVADWMLTSGLTHHEIVAIQVPAIDTGDDWMMRQAEIDRLFAMYKDVERQLRTLGDENLDLATDALMKRPDLARQLIAGKLPGPGKYLVEPIDRGQPVEPPVEPAPPEIVPDTPEAAPGAAL
jgi:hypothetical protein